MKYLIRNFLICDLLCGPETFLMEVPRIACLDVNPPCWAVLFRLADCGWWGLPVSKCKCCTQPVWESLDRPWWVLSYFWNLDVNYCSRLTDGMGEMTGCLFLRWAVKPYLCSFIGFISQYILINNKKKNIV